MSPRFLVPRAAAGALLLCGICGTAVLAFFLTRNGPGILVLLACAAACAFLYAFSPFPGSYLATSLVPALITGGGFFVMSGRWESAAFLAGIPVCLVSVGVILTYRVAYRDGGFHRGGAAAALCFHAGSLAAVVALAAGGIYPPRGLSALAPGALLLAFSARQFRRERRDPVPATSAGVFLHAALSLSLSLALVV